MYPYVGMYPRVIKAEVIHKGEPTKINVSLTPFPIPTSILLGLLMLLTLLGNQLFELVKSFI